MMKIIDEFIWLINGENVRLRCWIKKGHGADI